MPLFRYQRTDARLKGGSRQAAGWDGGRSITSDFTRACDSSACLAGDDVVDYTSLKSSNKILDAERFYLAISA